MEDLYFGNPFFDPEQCFIDPRATLTGLMYIEENVFIGPNASIRADEGRPFRLCKGCNIQDGVVIHGLFEHYVEVDGKNYSVYVGSHTTIAHQALIHGPTKIGKKSFVGFKATVHNAIVGRNCHIGHHALVCGVVILDGRSVKNGMIVDNQELADSLPLISDAQNEFNREVVEYNKDLCFYYRKRKEGASIYSLHPQTMTQL